MPGAPYMFSSGTGELSYVHDEEEESAVGRVFLLMDLAERTALRIPAVAPTSTLMWEWFAQDRVVYRLLIWSAAWGE